MASYTGMGTFPVSTEKFSSSWWRTRWVVSSYPCFSSTLTLCVRMEGGVESRREKNIERGGRKGEQKEGRVRASSGDSLSTVRVFHHTFLSSPSCPTFLPPPLLSSFTLSLLSLASSPPLPSNFPLFLSPPSKLSSYPLLLPSPLLPLFPPPLSVFPSSLCLSTFPVTSSLPSSSLPSSPHSFCPSPPSLPLHSLHSAPPAPHPKVGWRTYSCWTETSRGTRQSLSMHVPWGGRRVCLPP